MKGWMEEVRQLADQYTDPQSASMKRALFKISFSFFNAYYSYYLQNVFALV